MKFYYYKINNIENGSFYIGITTNYIKREKQHFDMLKRDDRCERKYKFIRITANQFAEINNLFL